MYVTICDFHGHCRSQVRVRNERLHMSSYLRIIVPIGLSGTVNGTAHLTHFRSRDVKNIIFLNTDVTSSFLTL